MLGNCVGLASLGIMVDFNADADVGCLRHCRRETRIFADLFIFKMLGVLRWLDADVFAPAWQKPPIAGGGPAEKLDGNPAGCIPFECGISNGESWMISPVMDTGYGVLYPG